MEAYDGSIDPYDHLESFKTLIILQKASDILMYKSFLCTFRDIARTWYTSLSLDSIGSFKEFDWKFFTKFQSSQKFGKNSNILFSIQ